ncbi:MAG TPA: extracellular solute-binding protein [Streptosporangiaceae bacterium]|nr:extracellular solute-binding protein [Streptosporangiaceae bacterium]
MSGSRIHDGTITIDVWLQYYVTPDFLDPVRRMAAEFSRLHPGYRIDIKGHHFETIVPEMREAVQRGEGPAVAEYFCFMTAEARDALGPDSRPLFTSATEAIGGRDEILGEPVVLGDIVPAARDYFSYEGELPAVPWAASTLLLFANTTLLDAAGVPEVPRTWDGLEAACRALARLHNGPSHGVCWPNYGWLFQLAVAQQGGFLADHDNGRNGSAEKVDLASAEMLAYINWWRRLHELGHYLYTGTPADSAKKTGQAFAESIDAFAQQRVAFAVSSSVDTPRLVRAAQAGGFSIAAARVPHNGEVPYAGNLIGGDALWLASGLDPKTRDGALAFIQYLCNPRNAASRHKATGHSPITRPAAGLLAQEGWFEANPIFGVASGLLDQGNDSLAARGALLPRFFGIHTAMTHAMHDVLTADAAPQQRFAQATVDAQRLLDDYRHRYPAS